MGRQSPTLIAVLCLLLAFFVSLQVEAATIATGSNHAVAIKSDGTLWSWGNNGSGQLGDGTTTNQTTPAQIGALTTWKAIAAGTGFTLALRSDGTLWAWGNNSSGQLGNGTFVIRAPYRLFPPGCKPLWAGGGHADLPFR
jgi:alpha-tubulin suppressor-like RCC1 family protein